MRSAQLTKNCGVGLLFDTYDSDVSYETAHGGAYWHTGRTGLYIAGFLDQPNYWKSYHLLCAKYKLVYQSPLRDGQDTGPNSYFFCVFDSK